MNGLYTKNFSLDSICAAIGKNKYNFDLDIQRHGDLWAKADKQKLIDTILREYPIYQALINVKGDSHIFDVVDFKQRFLTFYAYKQNAFAVADDAPPVYINGIEHEIAGKKYKDLDEDLQDRFNNRNLSFIILRDATEEELCDIFERINMGKPLNNSQKRNALSDTVFRSSIFDLSRHPLISKLLTKAQIKRGLDRDDVILALMLICTTDENDYTSFRSKDINDFVLNHSDEVLDRIDDLKASMDKLNEIYGDVKNIGLKQSTVPMALYCCYRCYVENKSFDRLKEIFDEFIDNYDNNEAYKQYTQSGTSNQPMVRGRFDYWRNLLKEM